MTKMRKFVISLMVLVMVVVLPLSTFAQEPEANTSAGAGAVSTGVQLQNVGTATTTATVNLVSGANKIPLADRQIPAGSALNYYFPTMVDKNNQTISAGAYALVAEADQPLQAIVVTEYENGAAGTYGSVDPATDVTLPIVFRNWASQNSKITVQNASSGSDVATVNIQVVGRKNVGSGSKSGITLQPGASQTFVVDNATFGISNNTGDMEDSTKQPSEGSGFIGYARVTSTGAPVVVQSFIDIDGAAAIAAFSGVDTNNAAAKTLYAPLLRSNFVGDTGLQLVNTNNTEANVTITYYTDQVAIDFVKPAPAASYTRSGIKVPANDSFVDFHGAGNTTLPDGTRPGGARHNDDITNGGWFGVAKIESDQPLIGVVQDVSFNDDWSTANQANYNVLTAAQAGTEFAIPLVRADWLDVGATTGIQVQNVTGGEITVGVDYTVFSFNPQTGQFDKPTTMNGSRLAKKAPANGPANLYQGDSSEIAKYPSGIGLDGGKGWFGSAIVKVDTAGGKIIALVNDEGNGIDKANFNAIKLKD